MAENQKPERRKRLYCEPHAILTKAFHETMEAEGHTTEASLAETILREGLQRRGRLPGPRPDIVKGE